MYPCILVALILAQWAGLVFDNHDLHVGSVVNATCGHVEGQGRTRFPDLAPFKVTTCNASALWNPTLPTCVGRVEKSYVI